MKRFLAAALALGLAIPTVSAWAQQPGAAQSRQPRPEQVQQPRAVPTATATPGLTSAKQKASYGIGLSIGGKMRSTQLAADDLDLQALVRGLTDALSGGKPALGDEELGQVMMEFNKQVTARVQDRVKTVADKNKKEGEAFLAANKSKEGVKTRPSGLQYKVLKSGSGPTPGPSDSVTANYKGTLLDGTVFDSSYDRGHPETFGVDRVIDGWTEALQLMKVGDKWQLFVPSNLAYREQGIGNDIGPNAVLVFEVELLDVKKAGERPKGVQE